MVTTFTVISWEQGHISWGYQLTMGTWDQCWW